MISLNLLELRKSRGITQSDLAEIIGVSFQTISKWENGTTIPDVRYIITLTVRVVSLDKENRVVYNKYI